MSNVHIIISTNKLENILKKRYLTFDEIKCDKKEYCDFYMYLRYDEKNIFIVNKSQYTLGRQLLDMLYQYSSNNKLFFATCSLIIKKMN